MRGTGLPNERRTWPEAVCRFVAFTEEGIVCGAGSILARMSKDEGNRLALESDHERVLALLSVAHRRPITSDILAPLAAAADHWLRGDKALANLRLVFADLPQLATPADAYRMRLAEYLLDEGMAPAALMKELGLEPAAGGGLRKYDPNQPRVPAGNGVESGRWGWSEGARALVAAGRAAASFLVGASPEIIASLAAFASRFSVPTAVLGALFIPTPNSGGVTEGTLPEAPDVGFRKDGPAGTLILTVKGKDGSDVIVALENRGGSYVDVRTGQVVGNDFGGSFYLDRDSVYNAIDTELARSGQEEPDRRPQAADDEPKLCPMPTPDVKHGDHGLDYEDDVHARVNPLKPLPRGFGVNLPDPKTGETVYLDDCFRYAGDLIDGDMQAGDLVEAKDNVEFLFDNSFGEKAINDLVVQAQKELRVADARGVGLKWYFSQQGAADKARRLFNKNDLERVVVGYMPKRNRK